MQLTWDDIRPGRNPTIYIRRAKGGQDAYNPLSGEHLRALSALKPDEPGPVIFTSELGQAFTTAGFAKMVERAGKAAGFKFKVHPHQLRHSCAAHLAPKINQLELAAHLGMKDPRTLGHYYAGDPERRRNKWYWRDVFADQKVDAGSAAAGKARTEIHRTQSALSQIQDERRVGLVEGSRP